MIHSVDEFVRLRTSQDPSAYGRSADESASDETWLEIIKRFPDMRFWVAVNKTIPAHIMELLASDPDPRVRGHIARKNRASLSILTKLASDPEPSVRHGVIANKKVPLDLLQKLAGDNEPFVARDARNALARRQADTR
jgi:hypothetical protein